MYYLAGVQAATEVLGLGPAAPWIFQDMTFTSFGSNAPNHAFHMGLLRVDGTEKPAAAWLRSYFGDR